MVSPESAWLIMVGMTARADCLGPKVLKRPQGDDRKAIRTVETLGQFVGPNLAGRIGRLALQGMLLVNRDAQGRAVDLARRGVDEALDPQIAGRQKDIQRADDVALDHLDRVLVRVRDGNQRPEVENVADALNRLADGVRVAQVAGQDFERTLTPEVRARGEFRQEAQQAGIVAGVVAHKGAHLRPGAQQGFGQVTADESARARHQDAFVFPKISHEVRFHFSG
jgi:hypothetical protein